jgi:hypothetical protein
MIKYTSLVKKVSIIKGRNPIFDNMIIKFTEKCPDEVLIKLSNHHIMKKAFIYNYLTSTIIVDVAEIEKNTNVSNILRRLTYNITKNTDILRGICRMIIRIEELINLHSKPLTKGQIDNVKIKNFNIERLEYVGILIDIIFYGI